MRNKFLLFVATLTSILAFGFVVDEDPLKNLVSKLEQLRNEFPVEKVHIHTDKPYYTIGDTIWFKAYVVNSEKNQLSALSKILYVELINEKDSVKKSLRLPVSAGLSWGDFTLTDSLREGNYRIRAYTTWMRNFGEEYFFDKMVSIGNAYTNSIITTTRYNFSKVGNSEKVEALINYKDFSGKPYAGKEVSYDVQLNFRNITKGKGTTDKEGNLRFTFVNTQPFILKSGKINTLLRLDSKSAVQKTFPIKATSEGIDVQFFPEGGQLVKGLPSKVAIKAVGAEGLGVPVTGYVISKNNERVASFQTEHAGMGSFAFTPEASTEYSAIVRFKDGSEKKYDFPKVANEGFVLIVSQTDTSTLNIKIATSPGLINGKEITVVGQSNHVINYVSKAKLETAVLNANVPIRKFNEGILQLTLFNDKYQPVAERLVYIDKNDRLNIRITSDKEVYGLREKVKLNLEVMDPTGKPAQGSFSLAVTNHSKLPFNEERASTIFSNLLLTSDLPGYIEDPNYYFTNTTKEKLAHLDNLMLTQGWRRFNWKNILSSTNPVIAYAPEKSIEISGKVTEPNGKPTKGGKVTLLSTSGDGLVMDTLTNSEGNFKFSNLAFTSNTNFVIKAFSAKGKKNVYIELNQLPPQLVTTTKNTPDIEVDVNRSLITYLENRKEQYDLWKKLGIGKKTIVLSEVKIVEKKPLVKYSSNLNGAGNADQVVQTDRFKNCINLIQCLQGQLVGVVFTNGVPRTTRGYGVMNVMVDGVFTSPDFLNFIHPNDVESIEVLRNGGNLAIYGLRAGNGIIMVNTKRGERNMNAGGYARGTLSYSPQGYYIAREFYSPKYDKPTDNKIPDLRALLFWKPDIVTDAEGRASVEFYNGDVAGTFRAVVEGLNVEGNLGRQSFQYQIR